MKILGGSFYVDRPLTRREWVRVKVFHRRDPRWFGHLNSGKIKMWFDGGVAHVFRLEP